MRIKHNLIAALSKTRGEEILKEFSGFQKNYDGSIELTSQQWRAIIRKHRPKTNYGLGDLVASIANPIARASDTLLGTKLVGCGSCAQRRAALNKLLPSVIKSTNSDSP